MRQADERELKIAKNSARNGFAVASILLLGFMMWRFLVHGRWDYAVSTPFFVSQVVYWGSYVYYRRVM